MKVSPILQALARRYEATQVGRTGIGERDLIVDYEQFLAASGFRDGDGRLIAEMDLQAMAKVGVLTLVTHRLDSGLLDRIRFSPGRESELFAAIGEPSPTERRSRLAEQFAQASSKNGVPERWHKSWVMFCEQLREAAQKGSSVAPFERDDLAFNEELLDLLPRLLSWPGESLVRFASYVLCGKSKRLEQLSGRLHQALARLTHGELSSLEDVNIISNPRFALIHGPLRLKLDSEWLDLGRLKGSFRLSQEDLTRAEVIETTARRCVTVENEASFHELAKLRSGELLVQTSFPGSGTLSLLKRLPPSLEFWHFGDSDEAGFDILHDLRERSGCNFQPLHMERGRRAFEQEALGRPNLSSWPFYRDTGAVLTR